MQYKIPQNVRRADTIVGPITFMQLAILLVGGGITYAWYMLLAETYYWYVWIWPVALSGLFTLALAFLKIQDMTFTKFALYMTEYVVKPRERLWRKGDFQYYHSVLKPIHPVKQAQEDEQSFAEEQKERKDKLKELTNILDQ